MPHILLAIGIALLPSSGAFAQSAQNMLGVTTSVTYAPVADPQQITLNSTGASSLILTGYDGNGSALSFTIVTPPSRGMLGNLNVSSGSVTYTPPAELSGSDSFTFSVKSGIATSPPATVTILLAPTPSFMLSASPAAVSVAQGEKQSSTIEVTAVEGFSGNVSLSASGLPSGVTTSFAAGAAGTQVVTFAASTSAAVTSTPVSVTITGTSGALTATTSIFLSVTAQPGFTAGAGGTTAITVSPGATTGNTGTVSVVGTNGFTGPVALQCDVIPTMTNPHEPPKCSLSPNSVTISGASAQTSTLTVTTTAASTAKNQLQKLFWPSTGGSALAFVVLFIIPRRRRRWGAMLVLLILIPLSVSGCGDGGTGGSGGTGGGGGVAGGGSGGGGDPGTTAGAYTITITGTSGNVSATVGTVTLTVQ